MCKMCIIFIKDKIIYFKRSVIFRKIFTNFRKRFTNFRKMFTNFHKIHNNGCKTYSYFRSMILHYHFKAVVIQRRVLKYVFDVIKLFS